MSKVYAKLLTVQSNLKAPKGNFNSFGKYKYRSCEDILEAVKPLLSEVGAVLLLEDNIIQVGDRNYVEAVARFVDCESEGLVTVKANAREEETKKGMDGAQVTGAASSYARKYALNGLFAIDDTKDADATNTHDKETKSKPNEEVKRETVKAKFFVVGGDKATEESFKEWEKGQLDKGYTYYQMNSLLTKKLPKEG